MFERDVRKRSRTSLLRSVLTLARALLPSCDLHPRNVSVGSVNSRAECDVVARAECCAEL